MKWQTMLGQKFGDLTPICRDFTWPGHPHLVCECSCGQFSSPLANGLRLGSTRSCGCKKGLRRHGLTGSGVRSSWKDMLARCYSENNVSYPNYGGRGIVVCARWLSLPNFYADMGHRPSGMSLGRINNDGDYEPTNCRWETDAQQARNTRRTRLISFNGINLCLIDWAEKIGIHRNSLAKRLAQGMPIEIALTRPPQHRGKQRRK